MKYEPCAFQNLQFKGDSLPPNDFFCSSIDNIVCTGSDDFANKLTIAEATGESVEMDFDIGGRDGLYDDRQLFAVLENQDVLDLIEKLKEAIQ